MQKYVLKAKILFQLVLTTVMEHSKQHDWVM